MFKIVTTLCFVLAFFSLVDNPFRRAPSIEAATNNIAKTTASVQTAAAESNQTAKVLAWDLQHQTPDTPHRLKEFTTSTQRLKTLRARLVDDIAAYNVAAEEGFKKFDTEAQSIKDPKITRDMTILRHKTEEDQEDRRSSAIETVVLLDTVLRTGSDLQHAANCVMISTDLHAQGETLDGQLIDARRTAKEYETTTNALLNRMSTVLAAEVRNP